MAISEERLKRQFEELVKIDSVSFHEREMADCLKGIFGQMGITLTEDETGSIIGGNAGNLHGFLEGFGGEPGKVNAEPLLFAAHMDTVEPGIGRKAVFHEDGRITSDGTTVLGADDQAAIAIYIEALKSILEDKAYHRPIELLFTTAEEKHTRGASAFDCGKLLSKQAYVLDCSGEIGTYSAQEPTLIDFAVTVSGKAAHAGFEPEKGINAIAAASRAISRIRQGWVNDHINLNIGTIHGGIATNVVSEEVRITGEIRSSVHEDAVSVCEKVGQIFKEEADAVGASAHMEHRPLLFAYRIPEDSPALAEYRRVLALFGISPYAKPSFGGSDNNVFVRNGIDGICLYNPMHAIHTTGEYTSIPEMLQMTRIVETLMRG